jgi:hypothetical protein
MSNVRILLGMLAGMLAGILIVIFNPFAGGTLLRSVPEAKFHSYTTGDVYGMHRSVDSILNLAWLLQGPGDFSEPAIRNTTASVLVLRDYTGSPVAFATRLSSVARNDNMLLGSLKMRTYSNVFWPNEGSVYMQAEETRRPMFRDGLVSFLTGGELSANAESYVLTIDSDRNQIVGLSGELADVSGAYSEVLLSPADDPQIQQGELQLLLQR